jgi:hypothetical protein
MSNHGKESTNKEGVNIDETQMKIDMGKFITHLVSSDVHVECNHGFLGCSGHRFSHSDR